MEQHQNNWEGPEPPRNELRPPEFFSIFPHFKKIDFTMASTKNGKKLKISRKDWLNFIPKANSLLLIFSDFLKLWQSSHTVFCNISLGKILGLCFGKKYTKNKYDWFQVISVITWFLSSGSVGFWIVSGHFRPFFISLHKVVKLIFEEGYFLKFFIFFMFYNYQN